MVTKDSQDPLCVRGKEVESQLRLPKDTSQSVPDAHNPGKTRRNSAETDLSIEVTLLEESQPVRVQLPRTSTHPEAKSRGHMYYRVPDT